MLCTYLLTNPSSGKPHQEDESRTIALQKTTEEKGDERHCNVHLTHYEALSFKGEIRLMCDETWNSRFDIVDF
jgi:hypothetical protein